MLVFFNGSMWQVKENSTQITGKDCLLVRKLQMFFFYFLNVNICFLLFADTYVLAVKPKSIATNKLKISWMAQRLKHNQEPGGIPGHAEDRWGSHGEGGLSWASSLGTCRTVRVRQAEDLPGAGFFHGGDWYFFFLLIEEFWGLTYL